MDKNYYLKLLMQNQEIPGVSVPFAATPLPKAPTPPPQRMPAQEDPLPEAREPIQKPSYQDPVGAPSPLTDRVPTMSEAFKNYYESQNKLPELFMKKYEALESQRQADREELDALKAKTFEGWRNKDLTPLMALTDTLTGSNLTGSYKAPTAEAENKAKIAAMENYLRKNAGQLSDIEIMAGQQDAAGDKSVYNMLRQQGLDQQNADYKQGIVASKTKNQPSSSAKFIGGPPKSWRKVDDEFAKLYVEQFPGGKINESFSNLDAINDVAKRFESADDLTGSTIGRVPFRDVFYPKSVDAQQTVENVIMGSLRQTLGAQFTEKEGKRVLEAVYNPKLDESVIADRLRRLQIKLREMGKARIDAAKYFQAHGSLWGYDALQGTNFDNSSLRDELLGEIIGSDDRTKTTKKINEIDPSKMTDEELDAFLAE